MTSKSSWTKLVLYFLGLGWATYSLTLPGCSGSDNGTGPGDDGDTTIVERAPEIECPDNPINEDVTGGGTIRARVPITEADTVRTTRGAAWVADTISWVVSESFSGVDTVFAINAHGADTCVISINATVVQRMPEIDCPGTPINAELVGAGTVRTYLRVTEADTVRTSRGGTWDNDTLSWVFSETFAGADTVFALNAHGADTCVLTVNATVLPVPDYNGELRLYVVEPTSRWNDNGGDPYHFGFLGYALDSAVLLSDTTSVDITVTWNGPGAGWQGITEDNIMVIAALFNSEAHQNYSRPPYENPFAAYYVDAAAGAAAGESDSNKTSAMTTHTVFLEEGTATWCTYCPTTSHWLHVAYTEGHNFYYVSMVGDVNNMAYDRLDDDYNIFGYPTVYFDGGDSVLVGGWSPSDPYINAVNAVGSREVPPIRLQLAVTWMGAGRLEIHVVAEHRR